LTKRPKILWRKYSLFNKWCWENLISICRRLKFDSSPSPCSKIHSKWIKDFNVRPETTRSNHIGDTSRHCYNNDFLNRSSKAQEAKAKVENWGYTKLKNLSAAKEISKKVKRCL
jgi:hypothetical protein